MTRVWNIDCHKWKNIGLITTWGLCTIGLSFALQAIVNDIITNPVNECQVIDWHTTDIQGKEVYSKTCYPKDITFYFAYFFGIGANFANYLFMWIVINNKYKLLQVKCVSTDKLIEGEGKN